MQTGVSSILYKTVCFCSLLEGKEKFPRCVAEQCITATVTITVRRRVFVSAQLLQWSTCTSVAASLAYVLSVPVK